MKITGVELRRIQMPLVAPFRTSFGTETSRDVLLLRVVTSEAEGWGECVATSDPLYSSEYVDAAADVLTRFFIPALAAREHVDAYAVERVLAPFKGHRMAKAALEMAVLDAELRAQGRPLARELGAAHDRVPCGVSVGIMDSIGELLDAVEGYLEAGYLRIKLKIEPGWDVEPVRAVRERFGDEVLLQVDANTAYTLADARHLARLDPFGLLLIEQPLDEEDVLGHAELAKLIRTPVCLDESITSARVGGRRDQARRMRDRQRQAGPGRRLPGGAPHPRRVRGARGAGVVRRDAGDRHRPCGQRRAGRAARVHAARRHLGLGSLLPHATSPSRSCSTSGHLRVPTAPGLGVDPLPEVLAELTTGTRWVSI